MSITTKRVLLWRKSMGDGQFGAATVTYSLSLSPRSINTASSNANTARSRMSQDCGTAGQLVGTICLDQYNR
jgi:hypothetical protein